MPEDQPKPPRRTFFDVARPGTVPTNATSKPVVVGHGVTQVDPMMRASQDEESAPSSAPELPDGSEELTASGINPNSIPLDAEDAPEVTLEQTTEEDIEPGAPPVASDSTPEPEAIPAAEDAPEVPESPTLEAPEVAAVPVEEPARGPASHPPKLLTEHADGGETEKEARAHRSTKHKIVIALLLVLVVVAVAFDVYLLTEYLKLK